MSSSNSQNVRVISYFSTFYGFIPLRIGLHLIAVQAVTLGASWLSLLVLGADMDYNKMKNFIKSIGSEMLLKNFDLSIITAYTLISFVFIILGVTLFFAALWDEESLISSFMWAMFLNVIFGFVVTAALGVGCIAQDSCIFSNMDWLSGALVLVMVILTLLLWMYYVCIANSYLENKQICLL